MKKWTLVSVTTALLLSSCVSPELEEKIVYVKQDCPSLPNYRVKKQVFEPIDLKYTIMP